MKAWFATTTLATTALLSLALLGGCNDKKTTPGATPPSSATVPAKPAAPGAAAPSAAMPSAGAAPGSAAATTPTAADAGSPDAAAGDVAAAAAAARSNDASAANGQAESIFEVTVRPNVEEVDPRHKIIEAKLGEELGMPAAVLDPISTGADVYAIYQHSQVASCAPYTEKRPASCPPAAAMALNPDCKGHGFVHAIFDGEDEKKPPKISTTALDFTGCDFEIQHWFAAPRKDRIDLVLEVVASYVAKREPAPDDDGDKAPPRDSIRRQQHLTLWGPNATDDGTDWLSEELASWTAETWRAAEPPVLLSFLLHDLGPFPQLAVVHLLPCYDPTSERACATELRKREVYRYATP